MRASVAWTPDGGERFSFDAGRKRMTTIDRVGERRWVHVKGAPDQLLERCTTIAGNPGDEDAALDERRRAELLAHVEQLAARGLRLLGFARRELPPGAEPAPGRDEAERDLTFLGLVALLDPPRAEVHDAVASCHRAGIRILGRGSSKAVRSTRWTTDSCTSCSPANASSSSRAALLRRSCGSPSCSRRRARSSR